MSTRDYLREQQAREALQAREADENSRAIATARRYGKNVTFIAHDGCEVTVTPGGHVFHNVAPASNRIRPNPPPSRVSRLEAAMARCEHCRGSGLADKQGPDDDELLDRVVLSAMAIDTMNREIAQLRAALEPFADIAGEGSDDMASPLHLMGTCDGCGAVVPLDQLSLTTFPEIEGLVCAECKRNTLVAVSVNEDREVK